LALHSRTISLWRHVDIDAARALGVATRIGAAISRVHSAGLVTHPLAQVCGLHMSMLCSVVHGDLTTSNMILRTLTAASTDASTSITLANGDKKVAIPDGADTAPVV
jgi:tRNA A-37 threonylcarbamoyl transferase component Bud32